MKKIGLTGLLLLLSANFLISNAQTTTITLAVGESYTLPAPTHSGATIYSAAWSSNSTNVTVQNLTGYRAKITVVNAFTGNVRITCQYAYSWTDAQGYSHTGSNYAYYLVECSSSGGGGTGGGGSGLGNETGVSLSLTSMNITLGSTSPNYIGACALPTSATTTFTWTSTNPSVATVSVYNTSNSCSNCYVDAHSAGTCYIRATSANGYTAQCLVTVTSNGSGGGGGSTSNTQFVVNGITYKKLTNSTCAVTYNDSVTSGNGYTPSPTYSRDIIIPSQVTYNGTTYNVTAIGEKAFYNCYGLFSITIPSSVISLGEYALNSCYNLDRVYYIGTIAQWCGISFASSPLSSARHLYINNTEITDLVIPNGVTQIKAYAFSGYKGLTSVTIPNSVTSIGSSAFSYCSGLTSVTIPNSVTSIGSYAFYKCSSLTSVTISSSVRSIGRSAFSGCTGLTSVTIPNSVTIIGDNAFYGCSGLTSVTIPNSVTRIENSAFALCTGLSSVTIPSSVTSIGSSAFVCVRHIEYYGNATGSPWGATSMNDVVVDGVFVYSDATRTNLLAYIGSGGSVTIPSTVTTINHRAFYGCTSLTSVTIPDSVTSIGNEAFYGCTSLTSVTIPSSVTSIGNYSFNGCTGLTSVSIPSSVTSIGGYAFSYVRHIEYHGNATGSPWGAFSMNGVVDGDFVYSNAARTTLLAYIGSGGAVTIPSTVNIIGNQAFYRCTDINSVTIPSSVTSIGNYSFYGCTGLTSVTIPSSVTSIVNYSFHGCTGLTSVTIPSSVTSIGDMAFYNCSGLTSVTIPNSVTSIGNGAFSGCTSLTSVTIPSSVTIIGNYFFSNCDSLINIYMLSSIPPSYVISPYAASSERTFYVPCGTLEAYQSSWGTIYTFSEMCVSYNVTTRVNDSLAGSVFHSINHMDTTATITASANYGYHFSQWQDGDTNNPRIVTLTQDTAFAAIFAKNQYLLDVISIDNSMGTCGGGGTYEYLDTVASTATSNAHHHFVCWDDGDTSNPRNVVIVGNMTRIALFAIDTHTVSLAVDSIVQGTFTGDGNYQYGTAATVTAIPYSGYVFSHWSDGAPYNPYVFAVVNDVHLTACFRAIGEPYQDTLTLYDTITLHDTTYVDVPYPVHDTTIVHDTTYVDVPYPVHDTTIVHDTTHVDVPYPVHDTTIVHDTTYVDVPYPVHDTTIVHDTTYVDVPYPVHDTTIVYDTTYVDVPYPVHDTTIVHDTAYVDVPYPVHDTTIVHDTTYVDVPYAVHDTTIVTITDTISIHDTTTVFQTDTLWLHDTVYLHDTIYIHDTIVVGVDEVDVINAKIYTNHGQIVVDGAESNTVWLYDVNGRILATKQDEYSPLRFDVPASGAYLVKIGNHPARKVVVIR